MTTELCWLIKRKHECRCNSAALAVLAIESVNYFNHQIKFHPTEKSHLDTPLEENVNRIILEDETEEARTVEDAIAMLRYHL